MVAAEEAGNTWVGIVGWVEEGSGGSGGRGKGTLCRVSCRCVRGLAWEELPQQAAWVNELQQPQWAGKKTRPNGGKKLWANTHTPLCAGEYTMAR